MFISLSQAGLVHIRHGRTTTVTGEPAGDTRASGRMRLTRPQYSHDCKLSGCKPHVCKTMAKSTIHIIHSILSGAFEAAERWQRYLSANCFGDYLTRSGIDVPTRELLTFAMLASLGGCDAQVKGHVTANLNVGNDRARLLSVLTVLIPFIWVPPHR